MAYDTRYKYADIVCEVPKELLQLMNDHFLELRKKTDIKQNEPYRQWRVQEVGTHFREFDEAEDRYVHWKDDKLLEVKYFFQHYVRSIFRFRYSFLRPGQKVDWHSSHRFPRIQIPLSDANVDYLYKDHNNELHCYPFKYGYAYLANVTWPHSFVNNDTVKNRLAAFFCFDEFADQEKNEYFARKDI